MNTHGRKSIRADDLRTWREYIETAAMLRARLESRLQADSSLSSGDYGILLALSEAEAHTMRASALAAAVSWEKSRLSHHVSRMQSRGLVQRAPAPHDPRGSQISLTDRGAASFRRASVPHLQAIRELFVDALTVEERQQLASVTQTLRSHLESDR